MIGHVEVDELKELLDSNPKAVLVDVREIAEFKDMRAPRAQLVPLSEFTPDKVAAIAPDRSAPVYLICRSGARSMRAAQILEHAGYSNLFNVEGGTLAWVHAGYEAAKG